ncbi:MAG: hypothetical protein V1708_03245 [Candidatus Micrarchaeota archaeon]
MALGDFMEDSIEAVRFGFSWLADSKAWLYAAAFFAINLIVSLFILSMMFSLFPGFANSPDSWAKGDASQWFRANPALLLIPAFLKIITGFVFIGIVSWIASSIVSAYVRKHAMAKAGLKTIALGFNSVARFALLSLLVLIAVMFNWMSMPLLMLSLAFWGALFLSPFIGAGAALLFVILIPAYFVSMIYSSVRFSQAMPAFLNEDLSMSDSLRVSWKLTQGRALGVFARLFVSMLICAIAVSLAFAIPNGIISLFPQTRALAIASNVLSAASSALMALAFAFAHTSIYASILEKAGVLKDNLASAPKPLAIPAKAFSNAPKEAATGRKSGVAARKPPGSIQAKSRSKKS